MCCEERGRRGGWIPERHASEILSDVYFRFLSSVAGRVGSDDIPLFPVTSLVSVSVPRVLLSFIMHDSSSGISISINKEYNYKYISVLSCQF